MKKFLFAALLMTLMTGCHLLPGRVEYFQKTVKPVPVLADQATLVQAQKQAAQFVAAKTEQAKVAAAATDADATVQVPLAEAAVVAGPLSTSLGPPLKSWASSGTNLGTLVNRETAKLDQKLDAYAKKVEPLEGKKIEGTGFIQMGFFTQWAIILGLGGIVWAGLKIYGLSNPVVGAGLNVAERVGSKTVAAGLHQMVQGGEAFKDLISKNFDAKTVEQIKVLFNVAHRTEQDNEVQALIKRLTV